MKLHKVPAAIEGGNDPDFYEGLISRLGDFLAEDEDADLSRSLNGLIKGGGSFKSTKQAAFLHKKFQTLARGQKGTRIPSAVASWASKNGTEDSFVVVLTQRNKSHGKNAREYGRAFVIDGAGVVSAGKLVIDHDKKDGTQGKGITGISDTVFKRKPGAKSMIDTASSKADDKKAKEQIAAIEKVPDWDKGHGYDFRLLRSFRVQLIQGRSLSPKQDARLKKITTPPSKSELAATKGDLARIQKLTAGKVGPDAQDMLSSFKSRLESGTSLTAPQDKALAKLEKYQTDLPKVMKELWPLLDKRIAHASAVHKRQSGDPKEITNWYKLMKAGTLAFVPMVSRALAMDPDLLRAMVNLQNEIDSGIVDFPQAPRYGSADWTIVRRDAKKWLKSKMSDDSIKSRMPD